MFAKGSHVGSFQQSAISLLDKSDVLGRLPPEVEQGNVEYKLKLSPSPERLNHLVTQLKWRIAEGSGEAIYELGVSDSGFLVGLTELDLQVSLSTLKSMGAELQADVSIVRSRTMDNGRVVAEVLVRKCLDDDRHFLEIRVAMLGGHDSGKSSLIGVLTHNEPDNGHGKSRLNMLRHRHEIETGRTSSISHSILGFDTLGKVINYGSNSISTWEQIAEHAAKMVTLMDTCGHPKHQKTTIGGLAGNAPHYACLVFSASAGGAPEVSKEHFKLCIMLKVPCFIVITKIDIATQSQLTQTIQELLVFLHAPGVMQVPVIIQNTDSLISAVPKLATSRFIIF